VLNGEIIELATGLIAFDTVTRNPSLASFDAAV
jgi:hypothetical protein